MPIDMSGRPGQQSALPKELPEDYSLKGLPQFDTRSRIARCKAKRQAAFAENPAEVLKGDLLDCYHGLTLWRLHKEGQLRVHKGSIEADKVYLGLSNAWLGVYTRVAAQVNGHGHDLTAEERIAHAFTSTGEGEEEQAPA